MNKFVDTIHNDDLGEESGRLYVGSSIDGMPVRTWYIMETLKRNQADTLTRVLQAQERDDQ